MHGTPLEDAYTQRTRVQNWLPLGSRIEAVPAEVSRNAVVVPRALGEALLPLLGAYTGAVIEDVPAAKLSWLIPPRAGAEWGLPGVDVFGRGSWVGTPDPWAEIRCRWRVAVEDADPLTEPDALRSALVTVLARKKPPNRSTKRFSLPGEQRPQGTAATHELPLSPVRHRPAPGVPSREPETAAGGHRRDIRAVPVPLPPSGDQFRTDQEILRGHAHALSGTSHDRKVDDPCSSTASPRPRPG